MNTYILRSGLAIRDTNISQVETSVDGFVSTFKNGQQKRFYYYTRDEKNNIKDGYYNDIELSNYICKDLTKVDAPAPEKFVKFEYAQTDDAIIVEIADITSNEFYKFKRYTFNHTAGRTYKKNNGKLDVSLMGIPESISNTNYDPAIKKIFTKHIAMLSQITDKKDDYIKYTIYSTLRANMILEELFPIFLENPNNISLTNLSLLLNEIRTSWGSDNINFSNVTAAGSESYYKALTSFYTSAKNYIAYIRVSNETERINSIISLIQPLSDFGISVDTKIALLKQLQLQVKLTTTDKNTINAIAMSFSKTQQTQIDDFLDKLLAKNNYICFEEKYFQMDTVKPWHYRDTITLFEALFKKLDEDTETKLWNYSPIFKEIHSRFPMEEKTSALHIFVMSIYALWIRSKYNPYKNGTYNNGVIGFSEISSDHNKIFQYSRNTATTFTVDNQNGTTSYSINTQASPISVNVSEYYIAAASHSFETVTTRFSFIDKIVIESNDYKNFQFNGGWIIPAQYIMTRDPYAYGYYNLYQPIQVLNISDDKVDVPIHSWDVDGVTEDITFIPAFLYHFMQKSKQDELFFSIVWLPVQAAWNVAKEVIRPIKTVAEVMDLLLDSTEEIFGITHPKSARNFIHSYALTH